jgi:eukaryotic-like serine/threonine-protein kinase
VKLKLKNYRVIKKIGHGGMGLVYVAEDLALGRLVALKVLAPYLVQDPEILERFRFEARNQAQLVHANITMVYSFLVEDEQAFLVLEFIDGETLESRINREGRIVAMEALPIFRKILDALGYAHSKGVIHRDIKPGNIAFTSEGNVKIMDFGIALNIEETGRLTKTGHVLGTPHYMAPEQILGKELTFRTDIYALGITLFEMLTGRLPFDSKSDYEVRVAQINHPPPSLRSFGYQDITPELEEVILKALAKEPEARFSSAREFLQALEAAVGRDHLVTRVKGRHLDKSTQILEANREPVPPPSEPEEAEPAAPPAEAPLAEGLAPPPPAPEREAAPAPSLAEVQDIPVAPVPEPMEELPVLPSSEPEEEEPSIPALSEQGGEAPSVPPPSELHREEEAPAALPSWEQQPTEPAPMPVPEQPFISPDMQTGWLSRPRRIFLTLSLVPLIALLLLFRAYFLTGPSIPEAMVSPQAKATASEKVVPPANHREEKAPVSAVPPATQPVSPVSKEPVSAELGKKAQDQTDKEKSTTMAALPPTEKKVEIPAVKEPKPPDLRKTVKESLAANGFSSLGVLVDETKGVFISGNVKNMAQKNKVIEIVNSAGLSMPADYSNLKVMKAEVAETVKKKRPEAPSTPRQVLEASPKPAPPEAPRKPLPPRMDRGNIQF